MPAERKRIEYIDIFRFFGILAMVMGHIKFGRGFDHFIHAFHMPMFFFASGLFFSPGKTFWEEFRRRFRTILLPYFYFGAINYAVWAFTNPGEDALLPLKHLVFINTTGLPIAGALWFLTAFFLSVMIYRALSLLLGEGWLLHGAVVLLALAGCLLRRFLPIPPPWGLDAALVGVGLYHAGAVLARRETWRERLSNLPLAATLPLAAACAALIFLNGYVNMRTGAYGIIPLFWLNALLCCVVGLNLARGIHALCLRARPLALAGRWMESVGRESIVYLCLNQLLIITVLNRDGHPGNLAGLAILVLTMAALWLIAALISRTGLRFMLGRSVPREKVRHAALVAACLLAVGAAVWFHPGSAPGAVSPDAVLAAPGEDEAALPDWDAIDAAPLAREDYEDAPVLTALMRDHMAYLLTGQWNEANLYAFSKTSNVARSPQPTEEQLSAIETSRASFENWREEDYLDIAGWEEGLENAIRPWAHLCFAAAVELRFGVYDDAAGGVSRQDAEAMTRKLIASLARVHASNAENGWGDSWQSALWAENIGFGAWLMWDGLSEADRTCVARMVISEADRFLDYDAPYYMDREGNTLYEGDTKGEENAWNARVLALAACMFPNHGHSARWETKMTELLLSAAAMPGDWESGEIVDGLPLSGLKGSNVNADGTVVNHGLYHVDYSATIAEGMLDSALIYALAGREAPRAALFRVDALYAALVNVDLGDYDPAKAGQRFYAQKDGMPTAGVDMPGENDWGGNWYASYYLMDTEAELFRLDGACPDGLKAADWARVHLAALAAMAARETDGAVTGQFFREGENNFVSGEAYQLHNLCKAYLLRRLQ